MKTKSEIEQEIIKIRNALDKAGFEPIPDYKKLQEHVYHQRLGALTFLRWVLDEDLEEP